MPSKSIKSEETHICFHDIQPYQTSVFIPSSSNAVVNPVNTISPSLTREDANDSISVQEYDSDLHLRVQETESAIRKIAQRRLPPIPTNIPLNLDALPPRLPGKPFPVYELLIALSIWGTKEKRQRLRDIYSAIATKYPDLDPEHPRWKESIRHKLSKDGFFVKLESEHTKGSGLGKLWGLDVRRLGHNRESRKRQKQGSVDILRTNQYRQDHYSREGMPRECYFIYEHGNRQTLSPEHAPPRGLRSNRDVFLGAPEGLDNSA